MKLYYKPGACSLASHIALTETGENFDIEQVDTAVKKTETGEDFNAINPKGVVPALKLGDGEILTEGPAILQHIADTFPAAELAAKPGTLERTRVNEHLTYVSSELHPAFAPFFSDATSDEGKQKAGEAVGRKFDYLNTLLSDGRSYLLGDKFSVADAYMFVVSNWSNFVGIDLKKWPNLAAFVERIASRPAAQAAMKAEGLLG
jgi:glutathione S-transferase